MLKKGFKALKSIGKKSKKKEKGDGDNVSQSEAAKEDLGGSREQGLAKGKRPTSGAAAYPDAGDGEYSGAAAQARSPGQSKQSLAQLVGSGAKSGAKPMNRQSSTGPMTREREAEDSVVNMMEALKAQKEAEKQKQSQPSNKPCWNHSFRLSDCELWSDGGSSFESLFSPLTGKEPEDPADASDSNESSSSETELTYKKKLKLNQDREERRKKGLSVSSSSSEDSSWGAMSDVLPSPDSKKTKETPSSTTKPVAGKSTTATADAEDSNSAWSDTDDEENESPPKPAADKAPVSPDNAPVSPDKAPVSPDKAPSSPDIVSAPDQAPASPDIVSEPASVWSDDDDGDKETAVDNKEAATVDKPKPVVGLTSTAQAEKDAVSTPTQDKPEVVKPSLNETYKVSTNKKEADNFSLSGSSSWSDSDDEAAALPTGDERVTSKSAAVEELSATQTIGTSNTKDDWEESDLPAKPSQPAVSVPTTADVTATDKPSFTRQESKDSVWSDDDSIELAAAPTANNESSTSKTIVSNGGASGTLPEDVIQPQAATTFLQPVVDNKTSDPSHAVEVSTPLGNAQRDLEVEVVSKKLADCQKREYLLSEEKEELRKELTTVQQQKDELQSTVGSLEGRVEDLQSLNKKLAEAEGGMVKKSMYDDVTQKLKVMMDENERLAAEQSELKETSSAEVSKLRLDIEQLEKLQKQHLVVQDEWENIKETLEDSSQTWQNKYSQLNSTLSQHQRTNGQLEKEISSLREKLGVLQSQKTEIEFLKDNALREVELIKSQLNDKDGHEQFKVEMERSSREYADKISRLNTRIVEITAGHELELRTIGDKHKQALAQLNTDHERDTQRADMRHDSLNKEISSLQSQNKDLHQKNSKLRTELNEKSKDQISKREYEELEKDHDLLQRKVAELQKLTGQSAVIEPEQAPLVSNMMFDNGLESRSREIQLRRERAERELQEAREKQRMRHNSTGTLTPASCESTPRRVASPGNFLLSASSSDDDEDIRHQHFNGSTSLVLSNVQQKELERLEDKVTQLKREVFDLEQSTSVLQAEKRTMGRQLQEKQDESDDLRVQNNKLYEKLQIRDQEVTMELNKKLEIELAADGEQSKLRQEVVLLESNASRLTEANSRLESRLATVTAELSVKENLLRSQDDGRSQSTGISFSDAEMVQLRTELAQIRSSADAERATFMAAIENKEREISVETAEKESAQAALDEQTKSLNYLQEDLNRNYISLSAHQDAVSRANDQEDRMHKELSSLREKVEMYSKDALEAKNVCSMQQILINEKDRELRDKDKDMRSLRRDLDGKAEALSTANAQLHQSARDRDRDHDRLRGEMLNMSLRHESPTRGDSINYKTMYDELRVDREREKATADQLIERLKRDISTLEERLQNAKTELQDKVKLETNFLLTQGEAERYKQEASQLVRKSTRLEEKVDQLQRETDHLKDSRLEVGSTNQTLRDENSRVREENTMLKSQLDGVHRELASYSVTREEMETALATAKLTTDVNDMTRQESVTEVQLERKHKMVLYKQAKSLRTEINEKNVRLQELERLSEKLKAKVMKLKAENNALNVRLNDRISADTQRSWDLSTGLTQADVYQQEVRQLQSQLESTTNDMQSQARKAKVRKHDLSYYQSKAETLEKKNQELKTKLNDSLLMVEAAERTASDLRNHIAQLNNRHRQYEDLDDSADMTMQELRNSRKKENRELERDVDELRKRLTLAESGQSINGRSTPRSRSASPPPTNRRSRTSGKYGGQPLTEYEKDRRALTRAAWAVLDDHGMGPPAEQRVFENLDRIWRRNASRPSRYVR